jgi:hypothetical protein
MGFSGERGVRASAATFGSFLVRQSVAVLDIRSTQPRVQAERIHLGGYRPMAVRSLPPCSAEGERGHIRIRQQPVESTEQTGSRPPCPRQSAKGSQRGYGNLMPNRTDPGSRCDIKYKVVPRQATCKNCETQIMETAR